MGEAGAGVGDVDHIQAHGVSLKIYDRSETNAYKQVFGERAYRIPVSASKSMVGQSYSVGGLLGVVSALCAMERGLVCPTINLNDPDMACDLDYVPLRARRNKVETALISAMCFGGTHAATVLRSVN
jgi:3-oxoacyl-(acyl-carrier-protein) synthase